MLLTPGVSWRVLKCPPPQKKTIQAERSKDCFNKKRKLLKDRMAENICQLIKEFSLLSTASSISPNKKNFFKKNGEWHSTGCPPKKCNELHFPRLQGKKEAGIYHLYTVGKLHISAKHHEKITMK